MKANLHLDHLSLNTLKTVSLQFLGDSKENSYNVPLSASPEWWRDLPVQNICVIGGEYELFLDDVEGWTKNVKV